MNTAFKAWMRTLRCVAVCAGVAAGLAAGEARAGTLIVITNDVTGHGEFITPPGVTSLTVEIWGGGGWGSSGTETLGGGGGGGGAYVQSVFSTTPGSTNVFVIGGRRWVSPVDAECTFRYRLHLDGTITENIDGCDTNGLDDVFDTDSLFVPVGGGTFMWADGGSPSISSTGGEGGQASNCYGNVIFAGGNGGDGTQYGGGGGGSAWATSNGMDAVGVIFGEGEGAGGYGGFLYSAQPGVAPGGGGGGASIHLPIEFGIGAPGRLVLTMIQSETPVLILPPNTSVPCHDRTNLAVTGTASAIDDDDEPGMISVTFTDAVSGDCGETVQRTWTATDTSGNATSAVQLIQLDADDLIPPVWPETLYLDTNGIHAQLVTAITNHLAAACGNPAFLGLSTFVFDCSDLGSNQVVVSYFKTCILPPAPRSETTTVVVADGTVPTVRPQNVVVSVATGAVTVSASLLTPPVASDNCVPLVEPFGPFVFTTNHVGTNTRPLVVYDSAGNRTTGQVSVVVVDDRIHGVTSSETGIVIEVRSGPGLTSVVEGLPQPEGTWTGLATGPSPSQVEQLLMDLPEDAGNHGIYRVLFTTQPEF